MTLNFNVQPYHDDFNEDKNFHKILFKPGVSVQGRELTQIQSILQDQIGKFGKFVLSDGSRVTGGRYFVDTNAKSLNLIQSTELSSNIADFYGRYVVGQTSKCIGYITAVDVVNFFLTVKPIVNGSSNFSDGENLYIFESKTSAIANSIGSDITQLYSAKLNSNSILSIAGCFGEKNSYEFTINSSAIEPGDVISIDSANNPYDIYVVTELVQNGVFRVNKTLDENYINVDVTVTKYASRDVMEVGFDGGVYFTNNTFVKSIPQTIIPNLKSQYPSCVVGYEVIESIIDFIDDPSLLDPAQGSYNYTAPGADRYKIYLQLVSKPFVGGEIQNLTSNKFIELLRIKNGIIVKDNTNPVLGELEKTLARQMYDHAGNYTVKDFTISFHDSDFSDSSDKLKAEISSGKAYIFGHEYEKNFSTFIDVNKGRDTTTLTDQQSSLYYGNRISIKSPTGSILTLKTASRIELHSTVSSGVNLNTFIAYANVRNIRYVSDTEYELYLYNISATDLHSVKSVVIPTSSSYATLSFAANVNLVSGKLPISDSSLNTLLFKLPYENIATLSNINTSIDVFDTISVISDSCTIHTGELKRKFSSGTGTLSSEVKKFNFIVVAKTTNGGYTAGQYVDLSDVVIVVAQTGSEQTATFTFTNSYTGQIDIKYSVDIEGANEKIKTEVKNHVSFVYASKNPASLSIADISHFSGVFFSPDTSSTYSGVWNSVTTYSKSNVVLLGNTLYRSLVNNNLNTKPAKNSSSWGELQNVSGDYILNNGQTETFYDHGTISAKSDALAKQVFVLFDYYTHSVSGDFFYFNSYPTEYSKVPSQVINNTVYDLKNYVDFRPRRTDNAKNLQFDTYSIPSSLFNVFRFDISCYLGRIDKLILTETKTLQWIKGIPSQTNYIPPADVDRAMTLALIQIDPYTFSKNDIKITYKKHRRYTMDDIGKLDQRISNVEYYTSLNMAEKDAMSRNIYDNVTGNRMTNGFVVDPFIGFGVMSIADNYKNCSLDLEKQELIPFPVQSNEDCVVSDIKTLHTQSNLVSFPFLEVDLASQTVASSTINCNPFDVVSYAGSLSLSPQSDVWVDVESKPIINTITDDTSALDKAVSLPGTVFNDWNTFYSTTPNKVTFETVTNNRATQDKKIYNVSTAVVQQSDITEQISSNIIPYARSIDINFQASNLSPLTKHYVYVNGRLVNAYVKPIANPKGQLTSISIDNIGENYLAYNTNLTIYAANNSPAAVSLEIIGGTISDAEFTSKGSGYPISANTIAVGISGAGSNAKISISTVPQYGGDLYSTETGFCAGVLTLPNDEILSFPSGELHILICDNPNYDITSAISKAEAIFYSSGRKNILQETIKSIREPYIKFVGWEPPTATIGAKIVTLNSHDYQVKNDNYDYSLIKTGTILLPVYLNLKPNSSVTVTCADASLDKSADTVYSISPSSLTFTDSNYSQTQYFTLTYDLGDRIENKINNTLFSYLEYYGSSDDGGYNYSGSTPVRIWENSEIPGVSFSKLLPKITEKPAPNPASVICSLMPVAQGVGKTQFYVTPSGEKLDSYLPITFTITPADTSICSVRGIYPYAKTIIVPSSSYTVTDLNELNPFIVECSFSDVGVADTDIVVTTSSSSSYWNGISATTTFRHIDTPLPEPTPEIILLPKSDVYSPYVTTEDGKTITFGVKMSTNTHGPVTVTAESSNRSEGIVTSVSIDGATPVSGDSTVFSSNNWNIPVLFTVTGQPDSKVDGDVIYFANLVSTSANSSWSGLTKSVTIVNKDTTVIPPPNPGSILYTYKDGVSQTSESGGTVTLQVSLDHAPKSDVIVTSKSTKETEGKVTLNSVITFTPSNWNIAQNVVVTGQADTSSDGLQNYSIDFSSSSNDSDFNKKANTAPVSNTDTTPQTPGKLNISKDSDKTSELGGKVTFSVTCGTAPTSSVSVYVESDNPAEGKVDKSTLTFTPSNWNVPQTVVVTGQNDNVNDINKDYNVSFKNIISSDPLFNNIGPYTYGLTNIAIIQPKGNIVANVIGTNKTSESGSTVKIAVSLDRVPTDTITVSAVSSDTSEGQITSGSSLTFNSTNYNKEQYVVVTGQSDGGVDGTIPYKINFTASCDTTKDAGFNGAVVPLENIDIDYHTSTTVTSSSSSTYKVVANKDGSTWRPTIIVGTPTSTNPAITPTAKVGDYGATVSTGHDGSFVITHSVWTNGYNFYAYNIDCEPGTGTLFNIPKLKDYLSQKGVYNVVCLQPAAIFAGITAGTWFCGGKASNSDAVWATFNFALHTDTGRFNYDTIIALKEVTTRIPGPYATGVANPTTGVITKNSGYAFTDLSFPTIAYPDVSTLNISVQEITTTVTTTTVTRTDTGAVISTSTNASNPDITTNTIFKYTGNNVGTYGGDGILNRQAYDALQNYFNTFTCSFPSNPINYVNYTSNADIKTIIPASSTEIQKYIASQQDFVRSLQSQLDNLDPYENISAWLLFDNQLGAEERVLAKLQYIATNHKLF